MKRIAGGKKTRAFTTVSRRHDTPFFRHTHGLFLRDWEEGESASFLGSYLGLNGHGAKAKKGVCEWANQKGER